MASARAKESAEEQEKRRRDEEHLALLQSRTEQKDSEARALAEERLQKQLLAEQKEKKLQELREKWVVSVAEQTSGRGKGAKDKEGGAPKEGKKKRKKGQQAETGDEEGDEADEALMRALSGKGSGNIDFGSSGEEDDEDSDADQVASARPLRSRTAAATAPTDDLFGDSDDEVDSAKARAAPSDDDDDAVSGAPARKRLKKASGAAIKQALGGSSDDEGEMDIDAPSSGAADTVARKQRVIDDDSD